MYNKDLIQFAKNNRKNQTNGERMLWKILRNKRFLSNKFRRQVVFENYILDFYCSKSKLCVEIDGSSHDETKFEYDQKRELDLRKKGLEVLRFTENDVTKKPDGYKL